LLLLLLLQLVLLFFVVAFFACLYGVSCLRWLFVAAPADMLTTRNS